MRAAKVQASLRIRAVSPEPPLLAHTSSESRGTFRQKARFLAPLNGWECAVKICHDGMLEDTNSLDAPHFISHPIHYSSQTGRVHFFFSTRLLFKCKLLASAFRYVPKAKPSALFYFSVILETRDFFYYCVIDITQW